MLVPSFLLKRLYVKGSLKNEGDGFQFQIKTTMGSGPARVLLHLALDRRELPLESSFFEIDGRQTSFTAVTKDKPFTLAMNKTSTLLVKGTSLSPGPHKLGIGFVVQGLGNMSFEVTDIVNG